MVAYELEISSGACSGERAILSGQDLSQVVTAIGLIVSKMKKKHPDQEISSITLRHRTLIQASRVSTVLNWEENHEAV
jgi:hypothetical protein